MAEIKELGKIKNVYFGLNDSMLGLHLELKMGSTGCIAGHYAWDINKVKHTEHCKWTEQDRLNQYADILTKVSNLLELANVSKVEQLKNTPIEATFENGMLKGWRILTEVL